MIIKINTELNKVLYQNNTNELNMKQIKDIYNYFSLHPDEVNKNFYNTKINKLDCPLFFALRHKDCSIFLLLKYHFNVDLNVKCNNLNYFECLFETYFAIPNEIINVCGCFDFIIKIILLIKYGNINIKVFESKDLIQYLISYCENNQEPFFKQFGRIEVIGIHTIAYINCLIKKYYKYDKTLIDNYTVKLKYMDSVMNRIENDNFMLIVQVILSVINNNHKDLITLLENNKYDSYIFLYEYFNYHLLIDINDDNDFYIIDFIKYKYMNEHKLTFLIDDNLKKVFKKVQQNKVNFTEFLNVIVKYNNLLIEYNKLNGKVLKYSIICNLRCNLPIFIYYIKNSSVEKLIDIVDHCFVYHYVFTVRLLNGFNKDNIQIMGHIIKKFNGKFNNELLLNNYTYKTLYHINFDYIKFFEFYKQYCEYDNVKKLFIRILKIYKNLNFIINNIDINKYNFYINPLETFNNEYYPDKYIKVSFLHLICSIKEFKYNKFIKSINLLNEKYPELINDNNNILKLTPLHCAVSNKNKRLIKLLTNNNKIDLYIEDYNKNTVFEYMILNNYSKSYIQLMLNTYDIFRLHNNVNIVIFLIRINNDRIMNIINNFFKK